MKEPRFAALLSFLLPGAGLAYLGNWTWAGLNFGIGLVLAVLSVFILPDQFFENYGRYLGLAFSGASAGLAYALTLQFNKHLATQPLPAPPEKVDPASLLGADDRAEAEAFAAPGKRGASGNPTPARRRASADDTPRRYISDDLDD